MKRFWMLCFVAALGLSQVACDAEEPATKPAAEAKASNIEEKIKKIDEEFADARDKIGEAFAAAKSDAEKQKLIEEFQTLSKGLSAKYEAIVKESPADPAVMKAIQFLMMQPDSAAAAIDVAIKHHLKHKEIGLLSQFAAQSGAPGADKLLRAVSENGADDKTKALATLGLGQYLAGQADAAKDDATRKKLQAEAIKTFELVIAKYPKEKSFRGTTGEEAQKSLFELKNLAVGNPIPDLTGKDLEGKPIKLSDYRGKVVLLDFWAHW